MIENVSPMAEIVKRSIAYERCEPRDLWVSLRPPVLAMRSLMVRCHEIKFVIMDFLARADNLRVNSKFKGHHDHLEKVLMGSWESMERSDHAIEI
jgi:hypothetical protein